MLGLKLIHVSRRGRGLVLVYSGCCRIWWCFEWDHRTWQISIRFDSLFSIMFVAFLGVAILGWSHFGSGNFHHVWVGPYWTVAILGVSVSEWDYFNHDSFWECYFDIPTWSSVDVPIANEVEPKHTLSVNVSLFILHRNQLSDRSFS